MGVLFPLLRRGIVSTLRSSFFLSFMCLANCILYLGYPKANNCMILYSYGQCLYIYIHIHIHIHIYIYIYIWQIWLFIYLIYNFYNPLSTAQGIRS
jgi:hypothetical protein